MNSDLGSNVDSDPAFLWQSANAHFEAGRHEDAAACCERLVHIAPAQPMAHALLSRIRHRHGRVRPATFHAFQAAQRLPGAHWRDILAVSSDLLHVGERQLAHGALSLINPHAAEHADALVGLGMQYSTLEDQPRAQYCIEQAIAAGRGNGFVDHMLSIVLSFTGDIARSIEACEASIAALPAYGHAHWSRAQFGQADGAHQRIARMRAALEDPGLSVDDTTYLHYGMFKEYDTLGQTDAAWSALMQGAAARRAVTLHAPDAEDAAFDALIRATPGDYLAACASPPTDTTPVFILGMPRTGTTLLERILGNYPQLAPCGELNDFQQQMQWVNDRRLPRMLDASYGDFIGQLDYALLGQRYLEKTRWRTRDRPFFSDKLPMNFLSCGPILKAIPHAKILHLRRHPMDACFSNLKELFARDFYPYSYTLEELARHHRNYERLMRHWHAIAPGRILDVRYEDLACNPEREAQRVQDYLGLPPVAGVTDILANKTITTTASTLQLRQPIHRRNVGGWRRYEVGLAPLQELLAESIAAYEE